CMALQFEKYGYTKMEHLFYQGLEAALDKDKDYEEFDLSVILGLEPSSKTSSKKKKSFELYRNSNE
ncbi:hypothetical protein AB751O23_BC_00010, partial [Chlamydiales bacterium SCGC AB-751-O23]